MMITAKMVCDLRRLAEASGHGLEFRPLVRRHDLLEMLGAGEKHNVVMIDGEFGQSLAVSITEVRTVLSAAGRRTPGMTGIEAVRLATGNWRVPAELSATA